MKHSPRLTVLAICLYGTSVPCRILGVDGFNLPRKQFKLAAELPIVNSAFLIGPVRTNAVFTFAAIDEFSSSKDGMRKRRKIGKKGIKAGTLNLIKAMAGTGMLALPMGVAKWNDIKSGIFPSILLMSTLGCISAYTFGLYGRLIHASQAKTLGELWEKKVNKKTAWLVSAASLIFCLGCCLSYSLCLGDVSSSLAETIGWNGIWISRQFWIIIMTAIILYPLCNLKSLVSLAPLSFAGVSAVVITTVFIAWRCPLFNNRSPYSILGDGELLKTLSPHQLPKFGSTNKGFFSPSSLVLFGMAAFSYLGHFTAPDLYHSFRTENENVLDDCHVTTADGDDADVGNGYVNANKNCALDSFFNVSFGGFTLTTIINCLVMTCGFLTFGGNSMGIILNNFSTLDRGATICRFFTLISVLGGYPFLIRACRGEILELLKLKKTRDPKPSDEKFATIFLLVSLTVASMFLSNAGLIIGLSGAVMGSALAYIFPSLLFLASTGNMKRPKPKRIVVERIFCRFLVVFGSFAAFASIVSVLGGA